jgi:hypothetical protein
MSRRDREDFTDTRLALVFIAGNVREAQRAETVLTSAGVDYCFDVADFTQGIQSSPRAGLGFYVVEGQATVARQALAGARLGSGIIEF